MHLLVDSGVGLAEILPPLAVAHDDVLDAQVLEHVGGDLAGVGALLLKVDVLSAHGDAQVLESLDGGGDVAGGDADQRLAPLDPGHDLLHILGELLGLGGSHVHLPVAGDDGLAISAVHDYHYSFMSVSLARGKHGRIHELTRSGHLPGPEAPKLLPGNANYYFIAENRYFVKSFDSFCGIKTGTLPGRYRSLGHGLPPHATYGRRQNAQVGLTDPAGRPRRGALCPP